MSHDEDWLSIDSSGSESVEETDSGTSDDEEPCLLHDACENGHLNEVTCLIAEGAKLNKKDEYGRTPLHFACYKGHVDVVKLLIEKEVNLKDKDVSGRTPLHFACDI